MKKNLFLKYLFTLLIILIGNKSFAQVSACITKPSADTTICRSISFTLSARNCLNNTTPSQESYSWTNLSNPGPPLPNNTSVIDSGRWEVTVTNLNDWSTSTAIVHVQYKPEPGPVEGPTTFGINNHIGYLGKCANTNATLKETSGDVNVTNHKWYLVSNNSLLSSGSSYVISAPVPDNNIALVALYTVTGCLLKDTIYISDFPEAKPELGNDINICNGQNVKLMPTGLSDLGQGFLHSYKEYEYDWGSGFQLDSELVVSTTKFVKLRVKGPYPFPCISRDSIQVTAIPNPVASTSVSNAFICYGDTLSGVTANASGSSGPYTYSWSPNTNIDNNTWQTVELSPLTSTVYTVTVTSANNCTGKATTALNVYTKINPIFSFSDTTICTGASVQFSGSATGGTGPYTYSWSPTTNLTGAGTATPTSNTTSDITYNMTVTDNNNCQANKPINVFISPTNNVNPFVIAGVNFADSTLCPGSSVQLLSFGSGGLGPYAYSWTPNPTLTGVNTSNPTASPTSNNIYSVVVKDSRNCTSSSTNVNVNIAPNVSPLVTAGVSFADSTLCPGSSMQLISYGLGGLGPYTYSWASNPTLTGTNTSSPNVSPTSAATYSVTVIDSRNCTSSPTDVNIDMLYVDLGNPTNIYQLGDSLKLIASNPTTNGFIYTWKDSLGFTIGNGSSYTVKSSGKYTVEVSNGTCFVSDSIELFFVAEVIQKIYVPNVFNPAMSESNNSNLRVYGNNVADENFLFRVYDQWSQLVYETDSFDTANLVGWNGTMKNVGQILNSGVYTYFVKGQFYDETTFEKTGTASLVR